MLRFKCAGVCSCSCNSRASHQLVVAQMSRVRCFCLARIDPPHAWQRILPLAFVEEAGSSSNAAPAELDDLCVLIEKGAESLESPLTDRIDLDGK